MTLDENELCMIEQLCYLNTEGGKAAGRENFEGIRSGDGIENCTIKDILAPFDDTAISTWKP